MTVQFLDISGSKMAVLPVADYERLLDMIEDRADAAAAALAHQRMLDGEESFPADFVNILLSGENRLRAWRKYRKLNLRELSGKVDLSIAYISELELGKRQGSPKVWRKLAVALSADVDDIIPFDNIDEVS